jgi:hypothetical protein
MLDTEVTIIKHKKEVDYTTIYNDCINDERLSTENLSILVYVMSKPDDWKIVTKNLSNRFRLGRDRVYNTLNDLISYGYMKRVRDRGKNGELGETLIYASDKPIFFKKEPSPELSKESLDESTDKQPRPEIQEMVTEEKTNKQPYPDLPDMVGQDVVPYIQKKDITKNNNNNLSTAREDAPASSIAINPAVVFLLDKIRNLPNFDITTEQMDEWVTRYGKNYVDSKIEFMKLKTKIMSQGGYLRSALMYDWGKAEKTAADPHKCEILMVKEDAVLKEEKPAYDSEWFKGLSEEEKIEVSSDAAKGWPLLPAMLEEKKLSVLDPEFIKSPWVNPMIDAFRNYRRL